MKILIATFVLFLCSCYLLSKWKKYKYENDFIYLKSLLETAAITSENYYTILGDFHKLYGNNQNKIRTAKLWSTFCDKYRPIWDELRPKN